MYGTNAPASAGARRLLSAASRRLRTADPAEHLGPFLDESLSLPAGSPAYRRPHAFETRFSETAPRRLALGMAVGDPRAAPSERVEGATRAMRYLVHHNFGPEALRWFDGRSEPMRVSHGHGSAWVASAFDRNGVGESQVTYSWSPQTMDSLPAPAHQLVQSALDAMPALRPAFTTLRCGRSTGSQEITFRVDGPLSLAGLRPLMDRLGLGAQHERLGNALAFLLGARFTLPPDSALVTLRPGRGGVELRIDVDLEAIPDVPPNLAALLQLQLVERPRSLRALEDWVTAFTPDGRRSPGEISVLSVAVRPDMTARMAVELRPVVVTGDGAPVAAASGWEPGR